MPDLSTGGDCEAGGGGEGGPLEAVRGSVQ